MAEIIKNFIYDTEYLSKVCSYSTGTSTIPQAKLKMRI